MRPTPACSIASNNYLAMARVLAESYRAHHEGAKVYVCVVDRPHSDIDYQALPFEVVFAQDLPIPAFENMAFRYSVTELNTAVKPFFLSHLRDEENLDQVFYFDPDILVCDRLDGLVEALDRNQVVLTPHITGPLDDDRHPAESTILQCGVYNLGFLGLRLDAGTEEFLSWWQARLRTDCRVALERGVFVDQSWMALAPAFLDRVSIARDPIYNVAYWNLGQRNLAWDGGGWRIDGKRLGFFHFSGLDLADLESVSRHQDRVTLSERPELRPLFKEYRGLVEGAGHERFTALEYGYSKYSDIDDAIPRVARTTLQEVDPEARRWPDPFRTDGTDPYRSWLMEPLRFAHGCLTRLALAFWQENDEARRRFPHVTEEDLPDYVEWLRRVGGRDDQDASLATSCEARLGMEGAEEQLGDLIQRLATADLPIDALEWLCEPDPDLSEPQPVLTRLALAIYQLLPDARSSWADPTGADRFEFARWLLTQARRRLHVPEELLTPVEESLPEALRRQIAQAKEFEGLGRLRDFVNMEMPSLLEDWLNAPADASGEEIEITNLVMVLHELRADAMAAWPDPLGQHRTAVAKWFVEDARLAFRIPRRFIQPVEESIPEDDSRELQERRLRGVRAAAARLAGTGRVPDWERWLRRTAEAGRQGRSEDPASQNQEREPAEATTAAAGSSTSSSETTATPSRASRGQPGGVNLAGYFRHQTGIGQMGRATAEALRVAGVPYSRIEIDLEANPGARGAQANMPQGAPYPVLLMNANADHTRETLGALPKQVAAGCYRIGYWYWELERFPRRWIDRFQLLDEVWVGSRFVHEAVQQHAPYRVRLVPPYVPAPRELEADRDQFGLGSESFVFFYTFDAGSVLERKNPFALVDALSELRLAIDRPVELLLNVNRGERSPGLMPRLKEVSRDLPLVVWEQPASRRDIDRMLATCDAVVSPHRSEGLGLLPIEALYLGKPIVATDYGGVTDYLDATTGFPVRYDRVELERDLPPYPRGAKWAEPSGDSLVEQMARVVQDPDEASRRACEGKRRVEELFGIEAASRRLGSELDRVFTALEGPSAADVSGRQRSSARCGG